MLRVSVVVPTRDRAHRLDRLLEALTRQTIPAHEREVVIVDNGSSDDTSAILARWAANRAEVRSVVEPVAGVSRARNRGIAEARAPVIAFLDDDVLPDPGWLAAVLEGFTRDPTVGIVAGPAQLLLEAPAPRWLGTDTERWLSAVDYGPVPRLLAPDEVPWTLNLAVRTDLAHAVGGFAENLGRVGTSLRSGEEPPFVARVREKGAAVVYEPGARVWHVVPPERLRLRWLARRAWANGRHHAAMVAETTGTAPPRHPGAILGGVALRGWRTTTRRVASAPERAAAIVQELAARTARLGAAWSDLTRRDP